MQIGKCSICDSPCNFDSLSGERDIVYDVRCGRCSQYYITDHANNYIGNALKFGKPQIDVYLSQRNDAELNPTTALYVEVSKKIIENGADIPRSILSHILRKWKGKKIPLTCQILVNALKNNSLPTPAEQANNLIAYLGQCLSSPGDSFSVPAQQINDSQENIYGLLGIKTGAGEWKDLQFVVRSLGEENFLEVHYSSEMLDGRKLASSASLSLRGWQKYEDLQRSIKDSRKAFVAMEFPNREKTADYFFQDTLLDQYLVPAAKKAGYDLGNALRSDPAAGNIHARLEVEIRAARFVVAELAHHNNGAYWEAGFARGLGEPVIYMYNKITGKSNTPHFDVGSDHYIAWVQNEPEKAAEALKAVIRATLFGDAVMED
jgi:hypothetical protein